VPPPHPLRAVRRWWVIPGGDGSHEGGGGWCFHSTPGLYKGSELWPYCHSRDNSMFTLQSLKAIWRGQRLDHFKAAHVGCRAPNPEVVPLGPQRGRGVRRLLDYSRDPRPLILNFGSCT
uniref:Iodothyronine deiodinase n=1 Tax=Callorhinchus milii TaxID=7868 RepID=A0A4W3JWY7_CALMI